MINVVCYCVIFFNVIFLAKAWPSENRSLNDYESLRRTRIKTGEIIFPDEYNIASKFAVTGNSDEHVSAAGKGIDCHQGICKEAKDYPYEIVNEIINRILEKGEKFNALEGNVINLPTRFKAPGEEDTEPLCATLTHTIYPKVMKNENEVEKFILNVENYQQGFVYETCVEGGKCRHENLFPSTSQCVQKYTRKRLLVLQDDKNSIYDNFIVPSCCQCVLPKSR